MELFNSLQEQLDVVKVGVEEISQDAAMCKKAIAGGAVVTLSPRVDTPKPKEFGGKRDAKELDNYIWHMERYFEGASITDEKTKVRTATLYLTDTATLWWRRKHYDIEKGLYTIDSWEVFKKEIKKQFHPKNVAYEARKKMKELKHKGSPLTSQVRQPFYGFISFFDVLIKPSTDNMFKGIYNGKQCHLPDISAVLSRAWSAGVDRIIVTGGSLEESKEALAIAETDARLFCTVGVHPTRCNEFDGSGDPEGHFQALLSLAKEGVEKGKVVAIGECGLDYDRLHFCPSEIQKRYFKRQFELAYAMKLPMFLHMRAAAEDFCDILEQNKDKFSVGVAHSFTGSEEERDRLLAFKNLFIGVNGCSLKAFENLDVVKGIPIERMMIETDSPYCEIKNTHAGVKFVKSVWTSKKKEKYDQECIVKGRNEPCLVRQVLEVVAGCKGITDITPLSKTLYHNTCRVFFPHDLDSAADALLAGSQNTP
ncbi:hypothetical protein RJ639_036160 [Escallonia herrerae]|uniref:Uncharacterized protein n=1 Tax=Escallonia herrerae TaxID=1293975 RepID=A0AA88WQX7_9ASTE|nr:hypothetical protein RJ639_036160 [Escallonia herrerae]